VSDFAFEENVNETTNLFCNITSCQIRHCVVFLSKGNHERGGSPSTGGKKNPSSLTKGGMPMFVTYADLIQFVILLVALVGLCHQIFKDKED